MNRKRKPKGSPPRSTSWSTALRLLTRRDYSSAMLRQRLLDRGFPGDEVDETLDRCCELGYLDDTRFAVNRARSLMQQGRAVGGRILLELRRQGISEHLAKEALDQVMEEVDQDRLLEDLVNRRFPGFTYLAATPSERRRVVHFLQRRGFTLDRILNNLTRKGL